MAIENASETYFGRQRKNVSKYSPFVVLLFVSGVLGEPKPHVLLILSRTRAVFLSANMFLP